jgi:hypothetical protein
VQPAANGQLNPRNKAAAVAAGTDGGRHESDLTNRTDAPFAHLAGVLQQRIAGEPAYLPAGCAELRAAHANLQNIRGALAGNAPAPR